MLSTAGFFCHRAAQEGLAGAGISLEHDAAAIVDKPAAGHVSNNAAVERPLVDIQDVMDIRLWETELRILNQPPYLVVIFPLIDTVR